MTVELLPPSAFEPIKHKPEPQQLQIVRHKSYWHDIWLRFTANRKAVLCLSCLFLLITLSMIIPLVSNHHYSTTNHIVFNTTPSFSHPFGTDELGRDILVRCCIGLQISFIIGLSVALIDLVIGVLWGAIAAYSSRLVDNVLMSIADTIYTIPYLIKVIVFAVFIDDANLDLIPPKSILSVIIAISLSGWINMARIVRGEIMTLKQREFTTSARTLGVSSRRILFSHLLPNALGPIIVTLTMGIATAVFTEAFLSYYGIGIDVTLPSLGTMIQDSPGFSLYPHRLFFPCISIVCAMMLLTNLGDSISDTFNPRKGDN
jgi:oligopeptide transport system permease protein